MTEDFIQYLWQYRLFDQKELKTIDGEFLTILKTGLLNRNAGPDFSEAKIRIAENVWAGNIEIHLKSSDWDRHDHSQNKAYHSIILHVVYDHDKEIPFLIEKKIPTLILKNLIPKHLIASYNKLQTTPYQFVPCEKDFKTIDDFTQNNLIEKLFIERLEMKSEAVFERLNVQNINWEALFFEQLAYSFGLKINANVFLDWAKSFDFSVLKKCSSNLIQLEALFFGQAGFLDLDNNTDVYYQKLKKEYNFIKTKHQLTSINSLQFKFFRLRPPNFPTIRLAQLAAVYFHFQNIFMLAIGSSKMINLYQLFTGIEASIYWDSHYTFGDPSLKNKKKKITKDFVQNIVVNTVVPIKLLYAKHINKTVTDELLDLMKELPAEKNTIVEGYEFIGATITSAMHSQAYLHLKKHYCEAKKCLNCTIGNKLLTKNFS